MKLYEINEAIENLIDHETGEILDYTEFAQLQLARDEKIENTALFVKNLRAEAAAIKAEREVLAERETAAKKKADRLAAYLGIMLDGSKFETSRVALTYRKSTAVDINEAVFMPFALEMDSDLLRYKEPKINKKAVADALKSGREIPGAMLVERNNLQIK